MRDTKRPGAPPALKFDTQAILRALRTSSPLVADQYLEFLVLNRNLAVSCFFFLLMSMPLF